MADVSGTPWNLCPTCGYATDHASEMLGDPKIAAKPGDFSVCLDCGELLRFGKDLELVAAMDLTLLALSGEIDRKQIQRIRRAQVYIHLRGRLPRPAAEVHS